MNYVARPHGQAVTRSRPRGNAVKQACGCHAVVTRLSRGCCAVVVSFLNRCRTVVVVEGFGHRYRADVDLIRHCCREVVGSLLSCR